MTFPGRMWHKVTKPEFKGLHILRYNQATWYAKPAYLVPVLSQYKLGGLLQQEGHPA